MNYAAFNDELLNAEIYGHEKGAFTGACQAKTCRFHFMTEFLESSNTRSLRESGEHKNEGKLSNDLYIVRIARGLARACHR